jgi:hypothetical protein
MGRLRRLEAYAARLSEETAASSLLAADANRSRLPPQPPKKPAPSPAGAAQKQRFPEKGPAVQRWFPEGLGFALRRITETFGEQTGKI